MAMSCRGAPEAVGQTTAWGSKIKSPGSSCWGYLTTNRTDMGDVLYVQFVTLICLHGILTENTHYFASLSQRHIARKVATINSTGNCCSRSVQCYCTVQGLMKWEDTRFSRHACLYKSTAELPGAQPTQEEMIMHFRRGSITHTPLYFCNNTVSFMDSFRLLGCTISQDVQ